MAGKRGMITKRNGIWTGLISFLGVALFLVELGTGMNYVQERLGSIAPNFLGVLPGLGVASLKVMSAAFWSYPQLEKLFQVVPMFALPLLMVGLGMWLGYRPALEQKSNANA